MINAKLQNIIDTKSAIGNAIVNKGGTITSETPFFNYAAQIDGISTGGGAYSTFVAQAQDNSLYTVYNGYDATTNPTPNLSNNFAFNRWLLNNSATGDVVLSNVVVENGGTFNGPNIVVNQGNIPFINNTADYGGTIHTITTNNGFIYAGGGFLNSVRITKYNESNLSFVSNSDIFGNGFIYALTFNNGFIYAGGRDNKVAASTGTVQKFNESTLAFVSNSSGYGGEIKSIAINNGFIYAGGSVNQRVQKFHESNLVRVGNTADYGGGIEPLTINNGFIYVGGFGPGFGPAAVSKYHESNLAFVGNTASYGGAIFSITTNNGFIYVGGGTNQTVQKFYESNLAFVGNTANYGATIYSVTTNNGFIYVGGDGIFGVNRGLIKFYESNLTLVGNSVNYGGTIRSVTTNNGFIYAGGASNQRVKKFAEFGEGQEQFSYYNITQIKE